MIGAIKAQFIDAVDQTYKISGKDFTVHYIIIIDEDANSIANRYVNLKVDNDTWIKLNLNNVIKVREYVGKMIDFHGNWTKDSKYQEKDGVRVMIGKPEWQFHLKMLKEASINETKK